MTPEQAAALRIPVPQITSTVDFPQSISKHDVLVPDCAFTPIGLAPTAWSSIILAKVHQSQEQICQIKDRSWGTLAEDRYSPCKLALDSLWENQ